MSSNDIHISGKSGSSGSQQKESQNSSKRKGEDRKARLSQALRENLKKRKALTRARKTESNNMSSRSMDTAHGPSSDEADR
nr:hypothetical protein [uncultured Cohaesibacter sp.]